MTIETVLKDKLFSPKPEDFDMLALEIFRYQAEQNPVYREYLRLLKVKPALVEKVAQIPFLPIELFKNHPIISSNKPAAIVFESSSTGGIPSHHYVTDIDIYHQSLMQGFRQFFGEPEEYVFLALLPAYLERQGSSLVYMVDYLMQQSGSTEGGYFLHDHAALAERILALQGGPRKVFIIGVSFALLDFAEAYPMDLSQNVILMETGGMKGRKKEIIREELHAELQKAFHLQHIASEYGMTELLSQAYAMEGGRFHCSPTMRVLIRESNDPFSYAEPGQVGGINVIDLANLNSCSFIAIQDLGKLHPDGSFEVLGRFDSADIRGCSLMAVG